MKELRVDAEGGVWRVAFAFDPKRRAILVTGGNKTGISKDRFYRNLIRVADGASTALEDHWMKREQQMTVSLEEILAEDSGRAAAADRGARGGDDRGR